MNLPTTTEEILCPNLTPPPILIDTFEAMRLLSIGKTELFELLKEGCFRSCRIGRKRLIELESLRGIHRPANRKRQMDSSKGGVMNRNHTFGIEITSNFVMVHPTSVNGSSCIITAANTNNQAGLQDAVTFFSKNPNRRRYIRPAFEYEFSIYSAQDAMQLSTSTRLG